MLRLRIRVGRPLGIPLWIHVSWFAVLVLATWVVTLAYGSALPRLPLPERLAMAVVTGLAFFACLATHEVAHAVVARRFGVRVLGITLFLLGGVAEIQGELPSPGSEFAVALVGPAASIVIGSVFALASTAVGRAGWRVPEAITFTLAVVNLGMAAFNLVPGLPLDGGRILRAAIWRRTGSFARGTRVAATGGRIVAVTLVGVGVVSSLRGDLGGLWYVPMGTFIWFMARVAGRAATPGQEGALALTREGEAA
jgi:Zn-dependent protease